MFFEVAASEVHNKETIDDWVWIVVRGGIWKAVGSEMLKVLTEDAFNEGGPAELSNDWRLEEVWYHIQQTIRTHYPVNLCLSIQWHVE